MHLQGTKPWTPAPTAYSAVRATLRCGGNARSSPTFLRITSGLPTIRTQSRSRRCLRNTRVDLPAELGLTKRMLLLKRSLPVEHHRKRCRGDATGDGGHQEALAIVAYLIAAPNKKSI